MENFWNNPAEDDRVDGRDKVTGRARYAAEHQLPELCYAMLVESQIARGEIERLDTSAAENAPGVLGVFSHQRSFPYQVSRASRGPVAAPGMG